MSITDELREYIGRRFDMYEQSRTIPIADRIDRLHAEAVADALQLRGEPDRWVELPVDADGVPIHVGDELDGLHYEDGTVTGIQLGAEGRAMVAIRPNGWDTSTWRDPEEYRHHQPDTWERIIKDALTADRGDAYAVSTGMMRKLVERCRRLAGDGE